MVFGEAGHAETDGKRLSLRCIEEASRCIEPVFRDSPQYEVVALGDDLGLRMVCRVERANPICSLSVCMPSLRSRDISDSSVPDMLQRLPPRDEAL
jgi:hypothetical protein